MDSGSLSVHEEMEIDMHKKNGWGLRLSALAVVSGALAASASAGPVFVYDEAVDGDLSNDWLAPTQFADFQVGQSIVTMSVVDSNESFGDRDYFTITIPAGLQLESIDLLSLFADGFDDIAFIGIQAGDQVTVDPLFPNPAPLLGWMLPEQMNVGGDILGIMIGEENTPLGPGQYSFWVQQTGQDLTTLSLGFNVGIIPSPGTIGLAGLAAFGAVRRRR